MGQKSAFMTARWDISTRCNLNCLHCCAKGLFEEKEATSSKEIAFNILDKLWQNGIANLNILGREPFLYPNINDVLEYACNRGFHVDITTNGTMIKENDIDYLVSLGMRSIFFSFDGSSPDVNDAIRGEGVFEKALATMQMFIEEKKKQKSPVRINVNTVLNRMNASNIPEIIDFCAYHGVNSYKLSHIDMIGNAETNSSSLYLTPREEFRAVEKAIKSVQKYPEIQFSILSTKPKFLEYIYKKYGVAFPVNICGCKACIKEIYIDPTGHVSPCLSTYEGFSKLLHNEDINYNIDIFESDDRPLAKYPFYKEFRRAFPLVKKTYKNYVPCNSCPYLATLCYPCPLGSTTSINRDELCLIADEKLNEMEAS